MKKILSFIALPFFVLSLLSSCTVQEEVGPDMFISRFVEEYSDFSFEVNGMFYEKNKCAFFVTDSSGTRFAVEMTTDEQEGKVQKISLACKNADKAENMLSFAKKIVSVYAPDENTQSVTEKFAEGKNFSYHETQWYYYSFSSTEAGLFFSVENKKLSPEKEEELTLRQNDIATTSSE